MSHVESRSGGEVTAIAAPPRAAARPVVAVAAGSLYSLGGLATLFFLIQVVTGVLLLVYYRPSAAAAHYSLGILIDEVRVGWLLRSIHYWSSDLLILCGLLHLIRVYFARAYQGERRAAWTTGVVLMVVVLAFGFTGTLLPWDQYAYWEVDSSRVSVAGIPLLGAALLNVFWGGWELGEEVLLRFYAVHVGILPWLAVMVLSVHLWLIARARRSAPVATNAESPSDLAFVVLATLLLTVGVLLSLAVAFPPPLGPPADPLSPPLSVQPRWYLLPARQLLRHWPGGVALLMVMAIFILVLTVPFIDRREVESGTGRLVRWGLGVAGLAACLFLAARQYFS